MGCVAVDMMWDIIPATRLTRHPWYGCIVSLFCNCWDYARLFCRSGIDAPAQCLPSWSRSHGVDRAGGGNRRASPGGGPPRWYNRIGVDSDVSTWEHIRGKIIIGEHGPILKDFFYASADIGILISWPPLQMAGWWDNYLERKTGGTEPKHFLFFLLIHIIRRFFFNGIQNFLNHF